MLSGRRLNQKIKQNIKQIVEAKLYLTVGGKNEAKQKYAEKKPLLRQQIFRYNPNRECACSSVDRASVFGTEGRGFESLQACQKLKLKSPLYNYIGRTFCLFKSTLSMFYR